MKPTKKELQSFINGEMIYHTCLYCGRKFLILSNLMEHNEYCNPQDIRRHKILLKSLIL